jgi:hypothetical protein
MNRPKTDVEGVKLRVTEHKGVQSGISFRSMVMYNREIGIMTEENTSF